MEMSEKLIGAWISLQYAGIESYEGKKHAWVIPVLMNYLDSEPEKLWNAILEILDTDSSEFISNHLGSGPLEDLIVNHGNDFIDRIEDSASRSNAFRLALKNVWLDDDSSGLAVRIDSILKK